MINTDQLEFKKYGSFDQQKIFCSEGKYSMQKSIIMDFDRKILGYKVIFHL